MKYIFFLGRIPELSVAEIQAMLTKYEVAYSVDSISGKILILNTEKAVNFEELLVQMGGTIKISEYLGKYESFESSFSAIDTVIEKLSKERASKKVIGYSIYFNQNIQKDKVSEVSEKTRKYFTELKKEYSTRSSMRIVFPDESHKIQSISLLKNKFLSKGIQFDFIFDGNDIILAKMSAAQDIDSYSRRDYGRPSRDAQTGMTPPKLAQIMINLAEINDGQFIFDPFCGVGTILQEALLNDYRVIGSDANGEQIENCKNNLEWISKKYIIKYPDYKLFQADSAGAFKKLNPNSIDALITESTLGPVYNKVPKKEEVKQNHNKLEKIYLRFFQNSKLVLRKKARIVLTFPVYQLGPDKHILAPFVDKLEKIGYSIICPLDKQFIAKDTKITDRNSIIYSRPNQTVAREVIIFENK